MYTHNHTTLSYISNRREKERTHVYIRSHTSRVLERRDDDMRSKTISYRRKKDITSREEKENKRLKKKNIL